MGVSLPEVVIAPVFCSVTQTQIRLPVLCSYESLSPDLWPYWPSKMSCLPESVFSWCSYRLCALLRHTNTHKHRHLIARQSTYVTKLSYLPRSYIVIIMLILYSNGGSSRIKTKTTVKIKPGYKLLNTKAEKRRSHERSPISRMRWLNNLLLIQSICLCGIHSVYIVAKDLPTWYINLRARSLLFTQLFCIIVYSCHIIYRVNRPARLVIQMNNPTHTTTSGYTS